MIPRLNTYLDFSLAIFEMENVLLPTEKRWKMFIDEIFELQDDYEPPEDYFRSFRCDLKKVSSTIIEDYYIPLTEEELEEYYKWNVESPIVELPFYVEASLYMNGLYRLNQSMAICSNLKLDIISKVFSNDMNCRFPGWEYKYFGYILPEAYKKEKPLKLVADNLNKEYRECILFDNKKSRFEEAKSLGMRSYYINNDTCDCSKSELESLGVTIIESFDELIN